MKLPAGMNDISEDKVTHDNGICLDCVPVSANRDVFDVVVCQWGATWYSLVNDCVNAEMSGAQVDAWSVTNLCGRGYCQCEWGILCLSTIMVMC